MNYYETAIAEITAPGEPYEITTITVRGTDFIGFKHAPQNLLEIYRYGLEHAKDDFYVFQEERFTYAEAWRIAAKVANTLLNSDFQLGDRVGISLRNYPEWIWAFMGITAVGGIATALNAWWTTTEMRHAIKDAGLSILIVDRERYSRIKDFINDLGLTVITVRAGDQSDAIEWSDWIADASDEMPNLHVPSALPATLLYTSGSTATPKGVLSSHQALTHALLGWEAGAIINWRAAQIRREHQDEGDNVSGPDPRERFFGSKSSNEMAIKPASILTVPLFHVTGLAVQMLTSFRGGRKLVGMYKWDVNEALRIIQEEKITAFNGVPTMSWELTQSPNLDKYDLSTLQTAGGGGAPMAPEHSRQINQKLAPGGQSTGWGMTETQGFATNITGNAFRLRPTSCGQAIPPITKIKTIDDDGNDQLRGETGELCIWGIMNCLEYWNDPDATASSMSNGWVKSGDVGYLDEEGFVYITDRKKDIVLRGGENISCQEVEAVLYEHPEIIECAVFGIPNTRLGEALACVVCVDQETTLSVQDIQSWAQESLARFKVPEHIWIRNERLPRTASEKIFKRAIRKSILDESV
ncbi:MAG: acyl--CoA ligase [Gammaproteobacteria bacterium]|nr:acyl--CoA ligase [Gammaproteobacteria bacterium]